MTLDKSKISIISATKVDPTKLGDVGDQSADLTPASVKAKEEATVRCSLCCATFSSILSLFTTLMMVSVGTGIVVFHEKRVNYSLNGVMRQIAWLTLPGLLCGSTMHYFLSEAMWSGKRNTWGQSWVKAAVVNTTLWVGTIGTGTMLWRYALPRTAGGRRLFHRYPIPTSSLDTRLLHSEKEVLTGMGWSYWMTGVVSGQFSFLSAAAVCVFNERPHFMMSPHGTYARRCLPPWRREQMARYAGVESSSIIPTSEASK